LYNNFKTITMEKTFLFTQENLFKLAEMIDNKYRPYTKDNDKAWYLISEIVEKGVDETLVTITKPDEKLIGFSYAFLKRKLDWDEICRLTGVDYYALNRGFEIKDNEIFEIEESIAKSYNLL
jgi:hypothetical protein